MTEVRDRDGALGWGEINISPFFINASMRYRLQSSLYGLGLALHCSRFLQGRFSAADRLRKDHSMSFPSFFSRGIIRSTSHAIEVLSTIKISLFLMVR